MKKNHRQKRSRYTFLAVFSYAVSVLGGLAPSAYVQAGNVFNGEKLYQQHCASCHGLKGRPVLPGAADFSRGQGLMQTDLGILQVVLHGKNAMPGFRGVLRESEILDVISYVRTL